MDWFSGIIVYLLVWWLVLFTTLPFGVDRSEDGPETAMGGAPENPKLKQKLIATTAISLAIWVIVFVLIETDVISFRELAQTMHEQDY